MRDGKCFEGGILKVDSFINHQMDPILMKSIAVEFVRRFASTDINKIITIEASGIAPAIMTGYLLELPVVFAKKKKPVTMENMLTTTVYSFTKNRNYDICVSKDFLRKGDHVLFIDDFCQRQCSQRHNRPRKQSRSHACRHGFHHRKGLSARRRISAQRRRES